MAEQALQARFTKKSGKEKEKQRKNIANDENLSKNSKNRNDSTKKYMIYKYMRKKEGIKSKR